MKLFDVSVLLVALSFYNYEIQGYDPEANISDPELMRRRVLTTGHIRIRADILLV